MRRQTSDPYQRLLGLWYAKRAMVEYYHRALRLLPPETDSAPEWEREQRRALNALVVITLKEVRQASDELRRYERERAVAGAR
jgi:hypothetical protein